MKVKASDFGVNTDNLPKEQKEFMEKMLGLMCEVINKSAEGSLSKDEVEKQFKSINDELKSYDSEKFNQLVKDNEELVKQVKNLGETLTKLQQKGLSLDTINKFDEKLNEMLDSEKFQDFVHNKSRKTGEFTGFTLKDVVSMTSNYTGSHLTTQQQNTVVSQIANKKVHLRDVLTTLQGDAKYPNLAFTQVYDFDRNARYVTENGKLPESSIRAKEIQTGTKRLGTFMRISKRMLKSRVYIRSYILNMLPEAVFMAEDYNILFGDGNGENLLGIANQQGVTAVEKIIAESIITGKAGDIHSITRANGGKDTIVEFAKPHDIILDGMTITFTGATTNANLNGTHSIVKMNDRQIMLVGVACTGEEEAVANMTFTVTNAAFKSIEDPNSLDVIKTAFAVMTFAQYMPNAIILNPITVNAIESEKDTVGRNLGLIQVVNGVKTIAGRPIIEYTGIPAGKYLLGDFTTAANLVDYTSLTLEWAEDVDTKIANEVCLIAQEEVIFPVYMPWAFAYGDLSALKTAITKD
ncbi:MAG: phage major capsid protein [Bacteroidales bacterium]|nr:phage major capsid protein [Bacteroidales bacterium]